LQQPNHVLPASASATAQLESKPASAVVKPMRQPIAFGEVRPVPSLQPTEYFRMGGRLARQVNFEMLQAEPTTTATDTLSAPAAPSAKKNDPCELLVDRPYSEFGINTAMPGGKLPEDHASECWAPINDSAGPGVGARSWGSTTFAWDATCLCYRPLYFEQTNLERYGYGCCESLQPAASAAHFFATIPALPYCMAADCPGNCNYTLGHYRPGDCNPWQCHWPPCSPRAILAGGGVWTGLVFLIP
jgi:hypothetical protein